MADLRDLYNDLLLVEMKSPAAVTGDVNTSYVDTKGYDGVLFVIQANATTADTSNYIEMKLYGLADGGTPTTASSYTLVTDDEVQGSSNSTYAYADRINTTGSTYDSIGLKTHAYRYYYWKCDETGTADAIIGVTALMSGRHQPAQDDTPATGTPA